MVIVDCNYNVASDFPAGEIPTVLVENAFQLGCRRITSTFNYLFAIISTLMVVIIFVVRWMCFSSSILRAAVIFKQDDALGIMTGTDLDDYINIWKRVYRFGQLFLVVEILVTVIVFLYTSLFQRYVTERIWKVKTSLLNDSNLIISFCSVFLLQYFLFDIHDFIIAEFVGLAAQTRLRIFYSNMIGNIGMKLQGNEEKAEIYRFINDVLTKALTADYSVNTD